MRYRRIKCILSCGKANCLLVFVLVLSVLSLTGCWDRTEVNDLATITAAGIDKKGEQSIELSVAVYVPKGGGQDMSSGGGQGMSSGGKAEPLIRSAEGNTIAEAMSRLQAKFPRRLFWGHCKVFIFSEKIAREGIDVHLDFILRAPTVRGQTNMFVSHGKAKDVLKLIPPLERNISDVLTKSATKELALVMEAGKMNTMLANDTKDTATPWIHILPPDPEIDPKTTIPYIVGTAIFRKGKMVGHIDDSGTEGLLWMRKELHWSILTVTFPETRGFVTIRFTKDQSKIVPEIKEDQWTITFKTEAEGQIIQNTTNLDLDTNVNFSTLLEHEVKKKVSRNIMLALNQVQKKMHSDVFGFGEAFHRKYPKEWNEVKDNWKHLYPKVEVKMNIKIYIRNTGNRTGATVFTGK